MAPALGASGSQLAAVELIKVRVPLLHPFRTGHGVERDKAAVLVRAVGVDGVEGWGECAALVRPSYTEEWSDGAWAVLRDELVPAALLGGQPGVRGHPMAVAALEAALLDLDLRRRGVSLARHLGAVTDRVPCGVVVGIAPSLDELVAEVAAVVAHGYRRVKLKVRPGWDVEPVAAVRGEWPGVDLGIDGNGTYRRADIDRLTALDRFGLVEVEQPLPADDLVGLAELAARLATPICLDESVRSCADLETALAVGAGSVLNLKPARVGGVAEAVRLLALAAERGVPVWVGGMLDTGVAKAVSVAVAALPQVTRPGDLAASSRWFAADLTEPFEVAADGTMAVPDGVGIGVTPDPARIAAVTVERLTIDAARPAPG